jgi:hypothetical protein
MNISTRSIVTAVKNQVSCDLSGEVVILNLDDGVYYGLNAVGARIWSMLETPQTVGAIHTALLAEYDVDSRECEEQVSTLLADLAAHGLIEVSS